MELVDGRANMTVGEINTLQQIYFGVQGIFFIIICCIGIVTNILNILTLMRSLQIMIYKIFLGMAVADLMHMISLLSYSLTHGIAKRQTLPWDTPPYDTVPLPIYYWFHTWFLFMCISNWCAALLVIFRVCGIYFPLKAPTIASNDRAKLAILIVYIVSFLLHLPSWIIHRMDRLDIYDYASTVSAVVSLPLPLSVCLIGTIMLVIKMRKQQKHIKLMHCVKASQMVKREIQQRQLTCTLIMVVCYFIFTNTILIVYFLMYTYQLFAVLGISHYAEHILYLISMAVSVSSYATNFFIYIVTNRKFRGELLCRQISYGSDRRKHRQLNNSSNHSTVSRIAPRDLVMYNRTTAVLLTKCNNDNYGPDTIPLYKSPETTHPHKSPDDSPNHVPIRCSDQGGYCSDEISPDNSHARKIL